MQRGNAASVMGTFAPEAIREGIRIPQPRHSPRKPPRACARGPLRLCRLLALAILLPCMFVLVPLYLRYRVYSGQMYPMSMTDMRLIDGKISPTWCQRQVVYSNATFNAYVLPGAPTLAEELVPVTMTRELELEDDMKEYWGFYLLKGSSVTVSACTRWPGASLIMIKGYKHLQECAYIGDDSSEEVDELLEAKERGLLSDTVFMEKMTELRKTKIDGKANDPGTMRRHKTGVSFHDPSHGENATSADPVPSIDVTDPNELAAILEKLHAIRQAAKTEMFKHYKPPDHLTAIKALHRHRDANVDKDERKWLFFKDIDGNNSEQVTQNVNTQNTLLNALKSDTRIEQQTTVLPPKKKVISEINKNDLENGATVKATTDSKTDITLDVVTTEKPYLTTTTRKKSDVDVRGDKTTEETTTIKTLNIGERARLPVTTRSTTMKTLAHIATGDVATEAPVAETNSKEVFEEVFQRLQKLGDKGKRVLVRLHERMGVNYQKENKKLLSDAASSSEELERIRRVLVEAIDEENNRPERQQKRRDARSAARAKRELMLGQIELEKELNEDDEARNFAAEEVLEDGHANIHDHVNETTAFDMSNSEFWSSFSSSEEALLECEGLILNLPLTPHSGCHPQAGEEDSARAARANALTYRVPANGYYFFVFNSENEVQTNFIKAKFDLQKTRYDVARTTLRECRNSTERCDLSLDIFSSQKVVLEVPLRNNDSLWNEQFVILSECEPRTSVYLVCVLSVPVLILLFAFQ